MAYNTASELERYMVELVNAERAKVGRAPLQIEQNLNESAERHSEWMLNADVFSHTGKGGSTHEARIKAAGFDMTGLWSTGENIALYSIDSDGSFRDEVEAMMQGLMDSPGHKENILRGSFDYIGIGIELGYFTQGGQTHHVLVATQDFGSTSETVRLDGKTGTASATRTSGADSADPVRGGAGNDKLFGNAGNDTLGGGGGRDIVKGRAGHDKLFGDGGNDKLFGQAGNDRLEGGAGRDVMNGGGGADTFVFREGHGKDRIVRFDTSEDRILLDDALWDGKLGKAQVVDTYAEVTSKGVLFDFDGNDDLLLKGLHSTHGLESLIDLI